MLSSVCTRRSSASRAPISEASRASAAPLIDRPPAADVAFCVFELRPRGLAVPRRVRPCPLRTRCRRQNPRDRAADDGAIGRVALEHPQARLCGEDTDANFRVAGHRDVVERRALREPQRLGGEVIENERDRRFRGLVWCLVRRTTGSRRHHRGRVRRRAPRDADADTPAARHAAEGVDLLLTPSSKISKSAA